MKIAVIGAKGIPARQGGIEHHCQELYPRMVKQGHQVDLYARSSYTRSLSHETVDGVRVISLPGLNLKGLDALSCSLFGTLSTIASFRNHPYDIIHFHALGPSVFCGMPRLVVDARVVVTCHGLDWARAKWGKASRWLLQKGEHTALKFADALIVVSEDLQMYFRSAYRKPTIYIPNAPASYQASDPYFQYVRSLGVSPGRYFLFLGRLVPEKRPDLLMEAFNHLSESDWKLVMTGNDSDSRDYAQTLKAMGARSNQIVFTGELVGSRLAEVVRGAGLLVLPSDIEGMPLVLLEAMNEGTPVLASDLNIHRSLTADGRGLVFKAGDIAACRQQLQWAMTHLQTLDIMADAAQRYVRNTYNWDQITYQTLAVYGQTLRSAEFDKPQKEANLV